MQSADQVKALEKRILASGEYFLILSDTEMRSKERQIFNEYVQKNNVLLRARNMTAILCSVAQLEHRGHKCRITVGCSL